MIESGQASWERAREQAAILKNEIAKVVVGQQDIVEKMLVALLCHGHCLIIDVPQFKREPVSS